MLESQRTTLETGDGLKELSATEIEQVVGGSLSGALAGGTTVLGGGMLGYGAAVAAGIGLAPVGVAALGVGAAFAIGYGAYEIVSNV